MANIEYRQGDVGLLGEIASLWEKLARYHSRLPTPFASTFRTITFAKRRIGLEQKAASGQLHVILGRNTDSECDIAYSVSSLTSEGLGEIESLYVEPDYRGRGIGDQLMQQSLAWLNERGARSVRIGVGVGNEAALAFYRRYNFVPRTYILGVPPDEG